MQEAVAAAVAAIHRGSGPAPGPHWKFKSKSTTRWRRSGVRTPKYIPGIGMVGNLASTLSTGSLYAGSFSSQKGDCPTITQYLIGQTEALGWASPSGPPHPASTFGKWVLSSELLRKGRPSFLNLQAQIVCQLERRRQSVNHIANNPCRLVQQTSLDRVIGPSSRHLSMRPYPKEGREKTGRTDTSQIHPRRQAIAIESSVIDGPTLLHDELRSHGWFLHDRQISSLNATTTTATDDGATWIIGWLARLISLLPRRYTATRPSLLGDTSTAGGGSGRLLSHLFKVKMEHQISIFQNFQRLAWRIMAKSNASLDLPISAPASPSLNRSTGSMGYRKHVSHDLPIYDKENEEKKK
ncbi:uncharacterized protein CLUP02_00911 [Colletotrichum lupini]|uniref:Uncharacterized protein n=1 Tax=Colletotrichum lupini TaxID=145971 RepID=A0A9Q8SBY3_9PEZI|nr:uncharacterized protein CLUP02_00911 [Colletotrichum lupini]UQC74263.1 hypothetical protein CLUP02_00911 [Colletotrichum lupini]